MPAAASWLVLHLGRAKIADRHFDCEEITSAKRRRDAVLVLWRADLADLDPPEVAADRLLAEIGYDILSRHRDERGLLIASAAREPNGADYAALVKELALVGRWFANPAKEPGARLEAVARDEIELPDVPRSRKVELYVLPRARAMSTLGLTTPPLRVVCSDRSTALAPAEVSAFYLPLLKAGGFTTKRLVWSDASADKVLAHRADHDVVIHAERDEDGVTFVRLAWITNA